MKELQPPDLIELFTHLIPALTGRKIGKWIDVPGLKELQSADLIELFTNLIPELTTARKIAKKAKRGQAPKAQVDQENMAKPSPDREDFSDFALVLKNGQELKCHRRELAKVSPVFCAMLKQDFIETQTNKMQVTEFEPETVQSFLDYVYNLNNFDKERLTTDLLNMCQRYKFEDLQDTFQVSPRILWDYRYRCVKCKMYIGKDAPLLHKQRWCKICLAV